MAGPEQYVFKVEHQPPEPLNELIGMEEARQTVRDIVTGCVYPDFFAQYGTTPTKSVFLDGGPGTGKSTLVKALTHEIGIQTGEEADLLTLSASSIYKMDGRAPAALLNTAFDQAKTYPGRAVLFFNEADGLLSNGAQATAAEISLAAICKERLEELRGCGQLVVAAATNNIRLVDPGIFSAHRFNTRIHLEPPQSREREAILRHLVKKARFGTSGIPVFAPDVDVASALSDGPSFTGGNMVEVVRRAQDSSVLRAAPNGEVPRPVTQAELLKIIQKYNLERAS